MSANTPMPPQVPASSTDVWQQFFREALRKRGKPAATTPPDEPNIWTGNEPVLAAGTTADDGDGAPAEDASGTESSRPHLRLAASEVWALALFGVTVFCFVSLLLYAPGDYFDSDVLSSRSDVSFSVGKAIFRPFGLAVYSLLGFTLFWSGAVFFRQGVRGLLLKAFGVAVFTTAFAGLLGLSFPGEDGLGALVHGGVLGEFLARRMTASFDTLGATALLVLVSLISLIFATDWFFTSLAREDGTAVADEDDVEAGGDDEDDGADEDALEAIESAPEPVRASGGEPMPVPMKETVAKVEEAPPSPETGGAAEEEVAAEILETAVRASRRGSTGPDFVAVDPEPFESRAASAAPPSLESESSSDRPRHRWRRFEDEPAMAEAVVEEDVSEPAPLERRVSEDEAPAVETAPQPAATAAPAEPAAVELETEPATEVGEETDELEEIELEPEQEIDREPETERDAVEDDASDEAETDEFEPERESESAEFEPEDEDPTPPNEEPPSAPEPRKAQLSLFDEVIDEIARSGRESRGSVPRVRPASPIPPVTATPAPVAIDAETYGKAVRTVLDSGRGSVSLLQRRLDVGYVTANRLLEMMERDGIVGEHRGSGPREVRTTIEEWLTRPPSGPETD